MSHPKFVGITDKMRITLDPPLRAALAEREKRSDQKDLDLESSAINKENGGEDTEDVTDAPDSLGADNNDTSSETEKEASGSIGPELVTTVDLDEAVVPEEAIVSNIQAEE
jgi:hypothetical protein